MAFTVTMVRHGLTEWARDGRYTGRTDLALLPEGEEQARALAPRLADRTFVAVMTSPLQRARRTAELAGFPDAELVDDLMEWDYGDAEGQDANVWKQTHPDWDQWHTGAPGGESPEQIGFRADRLIDRLTMLNADALLFAHGHLLDVLAARWLEQPVAFGGRLRLDPATISVLGWHHGRHVLLEWNSSGR